MAEALLMRMSALQVEKSPAQARETLSDVTIAEYAAAMKDGAVFPPVIAFGTLDHAYLADGFHRYYAADVLKRTEISVDLRPGDMNDAILFAAGANVSHGLRRSNDDKRRAVLMALNQRNDWSNHEIARHCGVTHPFVANVRRHLERTGVIDLAPDTIVDSSGRIQKRQRPAGNIGRRVEQDRRNSHVQKRHEPVQASTGRIWCEGCNDYEDKSHQCLGCNTYIPNTAAHVCPRTAKRSPSPPSASTEPPRSERGAPDFGEIIDAPWTEVDPDRPATNDDARSGTLVPLTTAQAYEALRRISLALRQMHDLDISPEAAAALATDPHDMLAELGIGLDWYMQFADALEDRARALPAPHDDDLEDMAAEA